MSYLSQDKSEKILHVESVEYRDKQILLTLAIPDVLFPAVQNFLNFSNGLFDHVKLRAKYQMALAKSVDPYEIERRKKRYDQYVKSILDKYDSFIAVGHSPRSAIRETKSAYLKRGDEITCSTIELVVRSAGRLRKPKKVKQ